jgi:structure-specific endonuclease subunit SLX1
VRFFSENVYKAWSKWCKTAAEPIRDSINIIQDFPTSDTASDDVLDNPSTEEAKLAHFIIALAVDYSKERPHVEKGKNIVDFEREGACSICHNDLEHDAGFYTICPNLGCESVAHLTCLSQHVLKDEEDELVPVKGQCPTCKAEIRWVNVVRELSLRLRGQKEVEKLLKGKRVRKGKAVTASQAADIDDEEDEDDDDELVDEIELLGDSDFAKTDTIMGDTWHEIDTSDDSDTESIISNKSKAKQATSYTGIQAIGLKTVIEDSDSEAEILD